MKEKIEQIANDIADRFFTAYPNSTDLDEIYSTERNRRLKDMIEKKFHELPDFNPMRIDEERFKAIYASTHPVSAVVKEYNATLPEPLKPLPKEIPNEFIMQWEDGNDALQVYEFLKQHYGTPSKPELPSADELEKEMSKLWGKDIEMIQKGVATYLHNKYSLHPPQQEWWMKLKKGDRFMYYGQVREFSGKYITYLIEKNNDYYHKTTDCTPYTESELERGLKQADEATKNLIKLACEEAIKTGKIPTI